MHRGRASFSHRQMRPVRAGDVRPRNWPWRWTSPPRSTLRPFPLESSCPPVSVPPQPLPAYTIQRHARTSAQAAVDVPVQDSRYCVFVGTASSLIVSESSIIDASSLNREDRHNPISLPRPATGPPFLRPTRSATCCPALLRVCLRLERLCQPRRLPQLPSESPGRGELRACRQFLTTSRCPLIQRAPPVPLRRY